MINSPNKHVFVQRPRISTRGAATVGFCVAALALFFFSSDLAALYYSTNDSTATSVRTDAASRARRLPKKEEWIEVNPRSRVKTPIIESIEPIEVSSFVKPRRSAVRSIIVPAKRSASIRQRQPRRSWLKVNPEMIAYTLVIYPKDGEIKRRIEPANALHGKRPAPPPIKSPARSRSLKGASSI
jgi:hypothetical protein